MAAAAPPLPAGAVPIQSATPPPLPAGAVPIDTRPVGDQPASIAGVADVMGDHAKRAAGAAWETVSAIGHLLTTNPATTAQNAFDYTRDAVGRTREAVSAGKAKEAALSALGAVPGAGPAFEQIAREIDAGQYPEAIGHAAAFRALAEAPSAAGDIAGTAKTAARVATDPAVVREGIKVLPKGAQALKFYDAIQQARGGGASAPPTIDPLLDQIAQSTAGKKFAALDPAAQATVQKIAAVASKTPAAPPPAPPAPVAAAPATAQAPTPAPVPAVVATPAAPAPAPAPVIPAPVIPAPVTPAPVVPEAAPAAAPGPTAAAAAPAPQVETIPFARPEAPAGAFAGKARAAKVTTLADTLDGVIPAEDVARMNPGQWQTLAKGLGITEPSPATVSAVIDELKTRAAARAPAPEPTMFEPSEAMKATLQKPGVLAAAKAMLDEMHPGKAAFARAKQASQ